MVFGPLLGKPGLRGPILLERYFADAKKLQVLDLADTVPAAPVTG